jgi:aminopeptidase N
MVISAVIPIEYYIRLDVSMEKLEYTGNVTIKIRAIDKTRNIRLDSRSAVHKVRSTAYLEKWEKYSHYVNIDLKEPMVAHQEEEIFLAFSGIIRTNSTTGFYASLTRDVLAITQFERYGANTVFPCFDDPALKAFFIVEVAVEAPFYVLGNMEVEKITQLDKVVYRFKKTLKLSTYLVAW